MYIYIPTHIQYYFIPIFPVIPYMNTGTPMVAPCLSLSRHGKSEPNDPDAPRESKGQKATATGRSETASEQSVFSWGKPWWFPCKLWWFDVTHDKLTDASAWEVMIVGCIPEAADVTGMMGSVRETMGGHIPYAPWCWNIYQHLP